MDAFADSSAQVCVIGRTSFDTGIGAFSHAACELFSRHMPTTIIPTDRAPSDHRPVVLPSGRIIPVCTDDSDVAIFFFADVLFNGASDYNLSRMPPHGVHIAHFCFDSDELPPEWVFRLNQHFEICYVPTLSQQELARSSGVRIPVGVLPIGLPIEPLLARTPRSAAPVTRFGTITAFHERKELDTLVRAFKTVFAGRDDVELVIHSNLAFGDVHQQVSNLAAASELPAVDVRHGHLSAAERDDLLATFDVFVNCSRGEGYSIGAREALALGSALVLSDVGVHRDFIGLDGVFLTPTDTWLPGHYPEIDGRTFGRQRRVAHAALRADLAAADEFVRSPSFEATRASRRRRAADFSMTDLSIEYASVIDASADRSRLGRSARRSGATWHPPETAFEVSKAWSSTRTPSWTDRVVVQAHDGGFYSVFNAYMSHLAWDLLDDRCHMVLPDWDQMRLVDKPGSSERESFCYGKFSDGNIWTHLFEGPFGCTDEQLNDVDFLYGRGIVPEAHFNERLEPMLTYYHAFDLYHSPSFSRFRRQYHEAYRRHVHLRPELAADIDTFIERQVGGRRLLAAHVKHPSHVIEQPAALMAAQDTYFAYVEEDLSAQGIAVASDDWRLFLGTDQEAVVRTFHDRYGDHIITFPEIRRSTAEEDQAYAEIAANAGGGLAGYQVQNLVAASPDNWSLDMARDILRDSHAMARADVLFHVVSNVATAISYLNPSVEMRFVTPR